MDTSKVYITMNLEAPEVQALRNTDSLHDYVYCVEHENVLQVDCGFYWCNDCLSDKEAMHHPSEVWLPRQDQLQEMLGYFDEQKSVLAEYFTPTCLPSHSDYNQEVLKKEYKFWLALDSWEKIILCLVMLKQHNKKWNGEEWIPQNKEDK